MSYESRCIMPRRRIRAAVKAFERQRAAYEKVAREAMEVAAVELLQVHGRHLSGYCQAMGTACFYARFTWYDKKTEVREPISTDERDENIPVTVQRAIEKWERDFYTPYTEAFGHGHEPLRATSVMRIRDTWRYFDITTTREW